MLRHCRIQNTSLAWLHQSLIGLGPSFLTIGLKEMTAATLLFTKYLSGRGWIETNCFRKAGLEIVNFSGMTFFKAMTGVQGLLSFFLLTSSKLSEKENF